MEIRSIKNVDNLTWKKFRVLAIQEGVSMASLLKKMVQTYEKKKSAVWGMIFEKSGSLSYKEAKEMEKGLNYLRKEKGFRI